MLETPHLLLCPFCGGATRQPGMSQDSVECKECNAFGPDAGDAGKSVALWNTRCGPSRREEQSRSQALRDIVHLTQGIAIDGHGPIRVDQAGLNRLGDIARKALGE